MFWTPPLGKEKYIWSSMLFWESKYHATPAGLGDNSTSYQQIGVNRFDFMLRLFTAVSNNHITTLIVGCLVSNEL